MAKLLAWILALLGLWYCLNRFGLAWTVVAVLVLLIILGGAGGGIFGRRGRW